MRAKDNEDLIPVPSIEERNRIDKLWQSLFDVPDPSLANTSAQNRLDVLVVEHRLKAERLAGERMVRTTKALVWATVVLAVATIALVYVTVTAGGHDACQDRTVPRSSSTGAQFALS